MTKVRLSRRQFFRTAAAVGAFSIVPRHVLGGPGNKPPSETLTQGTIGTGGMGMAGHVQTNKPGAPPVQLAVCDVDKGRLANAMKKAGAPCRAYGDWREVIDQKGIDIIRSATPPHWHALIYLAAAQAGKDAFVEKPFTRTIGEGQKVVDAVERHGRIMWIDVHGRTQHHGGWLRRAVMANLLGTPLTVRTQSIDLRVGKINLPAQNPPPELDYDMWLGPAPLRPYNSERVHGNFRWYWDYDGGQLTDWYQHFFDPIQYALGKDDEFPVEVETSGEPQDPVATCTWYWGTFKYADGTRIVLPAGRARDPILDAGVVAQGPRGRFFGNGQSDPPELAEKLKAVPAEPLMNFEEAVKKRYRGSGNKPNAAAAHHSCTAVNMVAISLRLGRKLRFDPATQRFIDDPAANALVSQPMRWPWHM